MCARSLRFDSQFVWKVLLLLCPSVEAFEGLPSLVRRLSYQDLKLAPDSVTPHRFTQLWAHHTREESCKARRWKREHLLAVSELGPLIIDSKPRDAFSCPQQEHQSLFNTFEQRLHRIAFLQGCNISDRLAPDLFGSIFLWATDVWVAGQRGLTCLALLLSPIWTSKSQYWSKISVSLGNRRIPSSSNATAFSSFNFSTHVSAFLMISRFVSCRLSTKFNVSSVDFSSSCACASPPLPWAKFFDYDFFF